MKIELADIMRQFGPLYLHRFSGSMLTSHKQQFRNKLLLGGFLLV
jgi:hypothetical protein